jgi:ubiquinone/menaquinone biosynthesis C-methylase UbiE
MPFDHFGLIAPVFARATYSSLDLMRKMADLPTTGLLLDVGGGTGRASAGLTNDVGGIVVVDVSFRMLKLADHSTLTPVRGISESLSFADNSFERIIMVDALHHVLNHADSAREMLRVLKPGGRIVIQEPDIQTFGVKLIALAEKMLLMRSHILDAMAITRLFLPAITKIHLKDSSAWVVVEKQTRLK